MSSPCLKKVPRLWHNGVNLKKVSFGRMNYRKVNFLGRHGSPMPGGRLRLGLVTLLTGSAHGAGYRLRLEPLLTGSAHSC